MLIILICGLKSNINLMYLFLVAILGLFPLFFLINLYTTKI